MLSERKWELAKVLAVGVIKDIPTNDRLSLSVFSIDTEVRIEAKGQSETLVSKVQALPSKARQFGPAPRRTALFDAILSAAKGGESGPPDTLIVITDGHDTASKNDEERVSRVLARSNQRLFAVVIEESGPRGRTPEEVRGRPDLEEIALNSGGTYTHTLRHGPFSAVANFSKSPNEIAGELLTMLNLVKQGIQIEILPMKSIEKPSRLELSFADKRKNDRRVLLYPAKLFPCSP